MKILHCGLAPFTWKPNADRWYLDTDTVEKEWRAYSWLGLGFVTYRENHFPLKLQAFRGRGPRVNIK